MGWVPAGCLSGRTTLAHQSAKTCLISVMSGPVVTVSAGWLAEQAWVNWSSGRNCVQGETRRQVSGETLRQVSVRCEGRQWNDRKQRAAEKRNSKERKPVRGEREAA